LSNATVRRVVDDAEKLLRTGETAVVAGEVVFRATMSKCGGAAEAANAMAAYCVPSMRMKANILAAGRVGNALSAIVAPSAVLTRMTDGQELETTQSP
jgi:hypothetical protein